MKGEGNLELNTRDEVLLANRNLPVQVAARSSSEVRTIVLWTLYDFGETYIGLSS